MRSRFKTPLKSWLFQASKRNCSNCADNCNDQRLLDFKIRNSIYETFHTSLHIKENHDYNFSFYRDDSLAIIQASPHQTEQIKKDICNIFGEHSLKVTMEANKTVVNFLDVPLNLSNGKHMPYNKSNNIPLYIDEQSNHPPRIISNISQSINALPEISHNKESFNIAAPIYQKVLNNKGYMHLSTFSDQSSTHTSNSRRKNRKRHWILKRDFWQTPIQQECDNQRRECLPQATWRGFPEEHAFHEFFNRNIDMQANTLSKISNLEIFSIPLVVTLKIWTILCCSFFFPYSYLIMEIAALVVLIKPFPGASVAGRHGILY